MQRIKIILPITALYAVLTIFAATGCALDEPEYGHTWDTNTENTTTDSDSADTSGTEPTSSCMTIELDLSSSVINSDEAGNFGIFAWVMQGDAYIDTIEFYRSYELFINAIGASAPWTADKSTSGVDGISSATVIVKPTAQYTTIWDCKDFDGDAVDSGDYTINVTIGRKSLIEPFGTHYSANISIGGIANTAQLELADAVTDVAQYPYDVLPAGVVSYRNSDVAE
jgi:hypothetical protein